jgi:hypothetical protein
VGDGAPSRPSKARGANIFASSRRDSNLEAFSRYPADVGAHHWPLGQVRAPEVRYCGSSRTEQGCSCATGQQMRIFFSLFCPASSGDVVRSACHAAPHAEECGGCDTFSLYSVGEDSLERENPRSGAASIDRSDQTALQGTAPQPNKSRLQADSERLYVARDGSERDGRPRETTRAHGRRIEGLLSLPWVYRSRRPREWGGRCT